MDMYDKVVLCGASAYEQKYYFNEQFKGLPESIKEELHLICVLFTEDAGGVFTVVFDDEGQIALETDAYDEDVLYDEISAGLLINELRKQRQELFQSLELYYRVFILKENIDGLLEE